MHNFTTEITKPALDKDFEDLCARVYSVVFGDPIPTMNGRSGQKQGGVDIFVTNLAGGRIGIQSKKYKDGTLKIRHIEEEVKKAEGASVPIIRLLIATTACSDANLISEVHTLSDNRVNDGKFPVVVQFWEDICNHIKASPALQRDYSPTSPGAMFSEVKESQLEIKTEIASLRATVTAAMPLPSGREESINKFISQQLDGINALLLECKFKDAQRLVTQYGNSFALYDAHQKARWHVQLAICIWHLDSEEKAAAEFKKAYELYPNDEKIAAAGIRGHLLAKEFDEALLIGENALRQFPSSAHVWIAEANARMCKGQSIVLAEVPYAMQSNCDVLQLVALSLQNSGQLQQAVAIGLKALPLADAGFFTRTTVLALALEQATASSIDVAFSQVETEHLDVLMQVVDTFTPRREKLWTNQSNSFEGCLENLAYAYIVLGRASETIQLVEEVRQEGKLNVGIKRAYFEACKELDRINDIVRQGKEWLDGLNEEGLVALVLAAAELEDISLIEQCVEAMSKLSEKSAFSTSLMQAIRWGAMWQKDQSNMLLLDEVKDANLSDSDSLPLICGGTRILHSVKHDSVDACLQRATELITTESPQQHHLLLGDLFYATERYTQAAKIYETLTRDGHHSNLHNRLLTCYVRARALRKAKKLIESFPVSWSNDENALFLAIELGQLTNDWEFLAPLAEIFVNKNPEEAGGWWLKLTLDLKMRRMHSFHKSLESLPLNLIGATRIIGQIARIELRYGNRAQGMDRLYQLYRQRMDDLGAASIYVISILTEGNDLPYMFQKWDVCAPGGAVCLKNSAGIKVTISIDPINSVGLTPKENFYPHTDAYVQPLIGAQVGDSVSLLGPMQRYVKYEVINIAASHQTLLNHARDKVSSPTAVESQILSLRVHLDEDKEDFGGIHSMIKERSEHGKKVLEIYKTSPITLGLVAKLLGNSDIDVLLNWPGSHTPLVVCSGVVDERLAALKVLQTTSDFVIDAVTLIEFFKLECESVLLCLPNLFTTTRTLEALEAHIEMHSNVREKGQLYDDDGRMQFVEVGQDSQSEQLRFFQRVVEFTRQRCKVTPAYGPAEVSSTLQNLQDILSNEEYDLLLLAAENNAVLLTVDGRLALLAKATAGVDAVWPQIVLHHARDISRIKQPDYSIAVIKMFMAGRTFISLSPYELVLMCSLGGAYVTSGISRVKAYLSDSGTEYESSINISLEFLSLQMRRPTQFSAFMELFGHIIEGLFGHPACKKEELAGILVAYIYEVIGNANRGLAFYAAIEAYRRRRIAVQTSSLLEILQTVYKNIGKFNPDRPVRLKSLKCTPIPILLLDGNPKEILSSIINDATTSAMSSAHVTEDELASEAITNASRPPP